MTLLLTVLGAVLCSMAVTSEVMPQADFNSQGMAGKWYLIGFATNAQWFVHRRGSMKMGTAMITANADGDLDISYASLTSGGSCWRMNSQAKATALPGRFTYKNENRGSENDMRVVEVKYDEYALAHTIKTEGGDTTVINKLYGRGVDLSADLLEKFKQFSLDTGVLPDNIAILPKNAECPAA